MATLTLLRSGEGGKVYELCRPEVFIGRSRECDVLLRFDTVSRKHAKVVLDNGEYFVEDAGSTNGTYLNNARIEGRTRLQHGDVIRVDTFLLGFKLEPASSPSHWIQERPTTDSPARPAILHTLDVSAELRARFNAEAKFFAMLEMIRSLGNSLAIDDVLTQLLAGVASVFPQADHAYILLADRSDDRLRLAACRSRSRDDDESATIRPCDQQLANFVFQEGKALLSGPKLKGSDPGGKQPSASGVALGNSSNGVSVAELLASSGESNGSLDGSPRGGSNGKAHGERSVGSSAAVQSRERDEGPSMSSSMPSPSRTPMQLPFLADDDVANRLPITEDLAPSIICAPLKGPSRVSFGVVYVDTYDPLRMFTPTDLDVLASVATLAGQAIENSRTHEAQVASERLAAVGQALASVAHESNNDLLSMHLGLKLLANKVKDRPDAAELVTLLNKSQQSLQRVLDEVQGYSAPIILDRAPVSLETIWRQAWAELEPARAERQAKLIEKTEGVNLVCSVDAFRLKRVFRNLIENALAACPDPVRIEIRAKEVGALPGAGGGPALVLTIADNGPGIPEEKRKMIFEPFFTTKTRGTGLGLAIVKRLILVHDGKIEVKAATGDIDRPGAAFQITLPRGT